MVHNLFRRKAVLDSGSFSSEISVMSGHPEKYLFSVSKLPVFLDQSIPKKRMFDFENRSTGPGIRSTRTPEELNECFRSQNEIKHFLYTLIQNFSWQIMKINNFRGELTDISAKKETLFVRRLQRMGI